MFALCPDNGPPRLWRYVDDDATMNEMCLVAVLYKQENILLINRKLFDELPELQRHMVLRTQAERVYA